MKEDMDRVIYRGYYELARKQEKEKVNKAKTIGDKLERERLNQVVEANASTTQQAISNTDEAIDLLDDQLRIKDKQIAEKDNHINDLTDLMKQKDKQIESLLKTIELLSRK